MITFIYMKSLLKYSVASALLLLTLPICAVDSCAQTKFNSTIKIDSSDSQDIIIEKAAHIVPTKNQLSALKNEFIAFIHIGPNTFTCKEWGTGMETPDLFALKELDTDQWCRALKAAEMKMVILTVKHHDGFVLWQSRYTNHGIMSTDFQKGKGDIIKDLSKSCKKYGLKLGLYLSPADLYQIENPDGLYGNLSKYTKRTIPREVEGRPFANKKTFEFTVDDYNEYMLNQLFEILTEYGPVDELWFDGAHPKRKGNQQYNYPAWKRLIEELAPNAVIFGKQDIRWCGNEAGQTREVEMNVIPYQEDPRTTSNFPDMTDADLTSRNKLYDAKYLHYQQAETNTSIREGWFYRDDTLQRVRSVDDVFDIYERSVGGNTTLLLNIPPNRQGELSPIDVEVLKQTGQRIRAVYGVDLLHNANGAKELLDGDSDTYTQVESGEIIISTPKPITINRLVLQEAIATNGERVEKHTLEALIDGEWKVIAESKNIGYKRILRFPTTTTDKLRIRIVESRLTPAISNITAHYYKAGAPRLSYTRDIDGVIKIEPHRAVFGWKEHGENPLKNLSSGLEIYYTTDGSNPTTKSKRYTTPFEMEHGELKAIAVINGQMGVVLQEPIAMVKKDWRVVSASESNFDFPDSNALDANPTTYWMSTPGEKHHITLDLGAQHRFKAFVYTPPTMQSRGLLAKGIIRVSDDGQNWREVDSFDFGNLKNDPTPRYHYLKEDVTARYLAIEATEIAEDDNVVSIAEIDLL